MLSIINKNLDEIIKYTGIAIIFALWASFTCMVWINLDDYEIKIAEDYDISNNDSDFDFDSKEHLFEDMEPESNISCNQQ